MMRLPREKVLCLTLLDDLTCARAIFAGWVFAYHLNLQLLDALPFGAVSPVVARGYLGVDGFFKRLASFHKCTQKL